MKLILLSATAFSAAVSFGGIRAITPDMWGGATNSWSLLRHNAFMKAVKAGGAPVVFIGDSITDFWPFNGGEQWQKYFASGKYRAMRLGICSDRTEHVLWRITEGGELDGYEAKCIVLLIGTNNTGHHSFAAEPPIDTILGIREILDVIREKQPKARTILMAIFPRGADSNDAYRRRNDVVNQELAMFADGKSVIWCDLSDKFLDRDGRLSRNLFPDLLHPNARGYEIWANAIIPLIDKALTVGPDEVIPSVWSTSPTGYEYGRPFAAMAIRGGNSWPARYREKRNEIVDNGKIEYDAVFVGDALTQRWESKGGEGRELYDELKKTYRLLNLGVGGDNTMNVAWRLENGELEGYKAKLFMVMVGVNNGGSHVSGIAEGIKRIVDDIRSRHPESRVLLLPILPHGQMPGDTHRVANGKINDIIKGYANGKEVLWVDFSDRLLEPDGTFSRRFTGDFLHLNAAGYKIWWESVQPIFKQVIGK